MLSEIDERIGTLSSPSKMPGYSWSISANHCQTGGALSKVPGTPCFSCYARKGRYTFPAVQNALEKRLTGYRDDPDWVKLMAIRLVLHSEKHPYFRWFDSGDLQDETMFYRICFVASHTEGFVKHWLPTQERKYIVGTTPQNLNVRVSSTKLDEIQTNSIPDTTNSAVADKGIDKDVYFCPSKKQGNKCGACRACWDKTIGHVVYAKH